MLRGLPRVLSASAIIAALIVSAVAFANAGPLASNDSSMQTYGQSGGGLALITAIDGNSCTVSGGGSRLGAMAFTSDGKLLTCQSGRWLRSTAWHTQTVTAGQSCKSSPGIGSFARGTDGELYVCR